MHTIRSQSHCSLTLMVDTLSKSQRSKRMALIRSHNTKPEIALRRALHARGLRYRLHRKDLPGKPDIVFAKSKTVIFVNGCFWHGHRCSIGHIPKSNVAFWTSKIATNRSRDARHVTVLRRLGWRVILVWECRLSPKIIATEVARLERAIRSRAC